MLAFLGLNDLILVATEDEVVELGVSIADGSAGKPDAALFIRQHLEAD